MMNSNKISFINLRREEDMKDSNNKEAYGCKYWRIFLEMLPAIAAEDLSSFVGRFRFAHDGFSLEGVILETMFILLTGLFSQRLSINHKP